MAGAASASFNLHGNGTGTGEAKARAVFGSSGSKRRLVKQREHGLFQGPQRRRRNSPAPLAYALEPAFKVGKNEIWATTTNFFECQLFVI